MYALHILHTMRPLRGILCQNGVLQVPIIVFHPVFAKYLHLASDCCPDAQTLKFTMKLVETGKWYFKKAVEDFIPVMQKVFQEYFVAVAGLSSIGDGKCSTDFSMQVMSMNEDVGRTA